MRRRVLASVTAVVLLALGAGVAVVLDDALGIRTEPADIPVEHASVAPARDAALPPQFTRIGDALLRAELAGQPSWTGLTDLAAETGVTELADTADMMRLAGRDGAAVYATLRARAASLRTQVLASSTAQANAASEHMVVPVSLLGLCFMALLGYPALMRILLS